MKLVLLSLFFFLLFSSIAQAQSIGIGVEPTVVKLRLSNRIPSQNVTVYISDPSDTPDNYTFTISDNLKDYMHWNCSEAGYEGFWCYGKSYYVPANTPRTAGLPVQFAFVKRLQSEAVFNGTITAKANPVLNTGGTVGISPEVGIRIEVTQTNESVTTSSTSSSTSTSSTVATTTPTTSYEWYTPEEVNTSTTSSTNYPTTASTTSSIEVATPTTEQTTTTVEEKKNNPVLFWVLAIAGIIIAVVAGAYFFLHIYF